MRMTESQEYGVIQSYANDLRDAFRLNKDKNWLKIITLEHMIEEAFKRNDLYEIARLMNLRQPL